MAKSAATTKSPPSSVLLSTVASGDGMSATG